MNPLIHRDPQPTHRDPYVISDEEARLDNWEKFRLLAMQANVGAPVVAGDPLDRAVNVTQLRLAQ